MDKNGILPLTTLAAVLIELSSMSIAKAQEIYTMTCRGGGNMSTSYTNNRVEIYFSKAPYSSTVRSPMVGECAWVDRPVAPDEPGAMYFIGDRGTVLQLLNAAIADELFYVRIDRNEGNFFRINRFGP